MMKAPVRSALAAAGLALLAPLGVSAATQDAAARPAIVPAGQAEEVARLVATIRKEIDPLPCTATPEDLEAAIVFSLSQTEASPEAVRLALRDVEVARGCHIAQGKAIGRIRIALLSSGQQRGTAAIGSDGFIGTGSMFSVPSINVGGGSANYRN